MDVVQASNALAALELIQRLPRRFRLVLIELDLQGISGSVLTETLRLFRPGLPTLCMSSRTAAGLVDGRRCLPKPLHGPDLQAAVENGMRTMFADGLLKCVAGVTTLEEVCGVTSDEW